ncbi:unnamed protein product [Parnassius apollo]|uniref:(apollo) hypothetical protein n=1 Tax=Parnassius apollo TaxID=110799 RepID=A0A8S3Y5C4_PARAO|nr:unnamed protein product [Parnassius apollo]
MSYAEISEDEDSFVLSNSEMNKSSEQHIIISSDEESQGPAVVYELTSDEDECSCEIRNKKQTLIKNLFPTTKSSNKNNTKLLKPPKGKGFEKMIGGIKVHIPLEPYGSQTALMFKVITAINKSQNCLLESPTGSGKTLALLCGALGWLRHERNRICEMQAQCFVDKHPELNEVKGAAEYVSTPVSDKSVTPEKFFNKPVFGKYMF